MVVSVAVLGVARLIGWCHFVLTVCLAPVAVAALWVADPLTLKLAGARMRPVALSLVFLAATVLVVRQMLLG